LAPSATTNTHLSGRIIPQSGSDLENIGVLFSDFLAGKNQTLTVQGDSVQPVLFSLPANLFFAYSQIPVYFRVARANL
jgi:hypothetical protein